MIYIENMPGWGFGNKVMYYNNLRQLAFMKNQEWSCPPWDGHQYFVGDLLNDSQKGDEKLDPCLGDNFFEWNKISTRTIFKLKLKRDVPLKTCAIHFRGTDFYQWNINAVLESEYYLNSIDKIKDEIEKFVLFTDDEHLPSFSKVKNKLIDEHIKFECGENTANRNYFINDFCYITECDWIISSPSTFCMCAGFIGKYKKIIHCKKWVEDRVEKKDKFWVDLYQGGNNDYSIWRLI